MVRIHERDKDGKLLIFESEKERNDYHWRHEGKPFVLMLFFFIVLVVIGYFLPESKEKPSDSFTQKTEAEANKKHWKTHSLIKITNRYLLKMLMNS